MNQLLRKYIIIVCLSAWVSCSITHLYAAMDWEDVNHFISQRAGHNMVFDSFRSAIILYGASSSEIPGSETWFWNGQDWNIALPITSDPGGLYGFGMAFDSYENLVIAFGGSSFEEPQTNLTWSWDGNDWTLIAPETTSPSPREDHSMVYDTARDRIVLFGGHLGGFIYSDETWEFDGTDWYLIEPETSIPLCRGMHCMVYDSLREKVVMFGGIGNNSEFDEDVWYWDGNDWQVKLTPGVMPGPEYGHTMAYDSDRDRVIFFGGRYPSSEDSTWEWDGAIWQEINPPNRPIGRIGHAMVYDTSRHLTIMFGGVDLYGDTHNDTWAYDGTDWTLIEPVHPSPSYRYRNRLSYNTNAQHIVLFGGDPGHSGYILPTDTWIWDGTDWTRVDTSVHPPGLLLFGMTFDPVRDTTVAFGGWSGEDQDHVSVYGETWSFNGSIWQQLNPAHAPSPRGGVELVYNPVRDHSILFGGLIGYEGTDRILSDETWAWDGSDWELLEPATTTPSRNFGYTLCYDSHRDRMVLWGGNDASQRLTDLWEWDGTDWMLREPATTKPPFRYGQGMVYDAHRRRVVMFGGDDGVLPGYDDIWEWDGYDWYEIVSTSSKPTGNIQPGMTYDSHRNRTVKFGGFGGYYNQETWEYYNTDPDCCDTLDVTITMPADYYNPGDACSVTATVCNNTGMPLTGYPLFVILDVYGTLFWGPGFTEDFDSYLTELPVIPENETELTIVPPFTWPDTGTSEVFAPKTSTISGNSCFTKRNSERARLNSKGAVTTGITFHAAITDPGVSFLYGEMDSFSFGWGN